jgi:ParB family chromosome partitioning protein
MQKKRPGLGRGLDALIPAAADSRALGSILEIPLDQIHPNPRQPRSRFDPAELAELATSIKEHGILQPLILRRGDEADTYTLIAGERRLQAARLAGLERVPCLVREATDQEHLELALIENVQRADLNPLEAAEAYRQLAEDFQLSHENIASRVGKSRTAISNTLRLLKLPETIQQELLNDHISEGHARALLALPTPQAQTAVFKIILERSLNVRQTEELVRKYQGQKPARQKSSYMNPQIHAIEDRLRNHLGTRVRLYHGKKGGSITIHYYSEEELDNLVNRILGD